MYGILSVITKKARLARFSLVVCFFIIMQVTLIFPVAFLLFQAQPVDVDADELFSFAILSCFGFILSSVGFYWVMIFLFGKMRKNRF